MLPRISQLKQNDTAIKAVCFVAVFFCFCVLFLPKPASAQAEDAFGLRPVEQGLFLGGGDIRVIIARIIQVTLGFLGIIAVVLILYAGYTIMTSGGDENKVAEGKKIIQNAVIGLAIILSAFAIVQFVINQLASATGARGVTSARRPVSRATFGGSGALGSIIADHYPFRDERDVRRNTRIAVTFREAIDPASVITDTNGNGIFGDCVQPAGRPLNWATDCDQADQNAVRIFPTQNDARLVSAAALAVDDGNGNVLIVVFRPIELLGSDIEPVGYTVDLTENILKSDGQTSAFIADRDGRYFWEFETGTLLDTEPPRVVDVYPVAGETVARNSIVQATFSEAMDPSVVQGRVGPAGNFRQIIFGSQAISGRWQVTNAYRTVEFVSDVACGENSCGEQIYCLPPTPSPCPGGVQCRATLIRTGEPVSAGSFESLPLSGVVDMAGNALDGNGDGTADGKPTLPPDARTVGIGENAPDNYLWEFTVNNTIDSRAPYVQRVSPGIDFEAVPAEAPVEITFSGRMWAGTLAGMSLLEHGTQLPPPWYRVRSSVDASSRTVAKLDHRDFIDSTDTDNDGILNIVYYFPFTPGTVKNVTQNCLYPGRGPASNVPNTTPTCIYEEDENGQPLANTGTNCVPVTRLPATDSGCVYTNVPGPGSWLAGNLPACEARLRQVSPLE